MHIANTIVVQTVRVAQVIILSAIVLVVYYATDRDPPFAVLSVDPTFARPGDYVTIRARVRRDVARRCDAEFSRYLYDSGGARFDLGHSIASAEMIERMESVAPNTLVVSVRLPETMSPGPANMKTVLAYTCNKTHALVPIMVTTDLPFTVIEP